jgi:hypothetical protein
MNGFAMSILTVRFIFAFRWFVQRTLALSAISATMAGVAVAAEPSDTLVVREALGIAIPRRTFSSVIACNPVEAWFSGGRARVPAEGETVRFADGTEAKWYRIVSDSNGWFPNESYAERFLAVTINRKAPARLILEGMGHDIVYVNGTPPAGNPYQQKEERESWEPRFDYS